MNYLHEDPHIKAMVESWDDIQLFYPLAMILVKFSDYIEDQILKSDLSEDAKKAAIEAILDDESLEEFITRIKGTWEIPWKLDIVSALNETNRIP